MRAMAGGGRYDQLIELFGGPATPGVGFGMGDVVLSDVLTDKGLMPEDVTPRPAAVGFAATDLGATKISSVIATLRRQNVHARMSYKTSRNVGKLLKDATTAKAKFAVILGDDAVKNIVQLKDLATGTQTDVLVHNLAKLMV